MDDAVKFQFDTVFDRDGNVVAAPPPRPKTRFSREDIDAAFAEGQTAGQADAQAEAARMVAAALQDVAGQLTGILQSLKTETDMARGEAARLAFETGSALARKLIDAQPEEEVTALIGECLALMRDTPQITIRVPPEVADAAAADIQKVAEANGFEGAVQIEKDTTLQGTDCKLTWIGGGATLSLEQKIEAIHSLIADHLATESPTQLDLFNA